MSERLSIRRLVAGLLDAWHAKGHPLGPGKFMQVEELLRSLPTDTAPQALRSLLAPLFASSAEEQRDFYALFDQVRKGLSADTDTDTGPTPPPKESEPVEEKRWRRLALAALLVLASVAGSVFDPETRASWLWLAAAVAAAALGGWKLLPAGTARWRYLSAIPLLCAAGFALKMAVVTPSVEPIPSLRRERFSLAQGDSTLRPLRAQGDTARLLEALSCSGETRGETPAGNAFALEEEEMLHFRAASDAVPGSSDSLCVTTLYTGRRDTLWFIVDILEKIGEDTGRIAELPLPFPRDLSELEVDPEALRRSELIHKYRWPIKGLLFLLGAWAFWAFLRWDERRRARFVAEIEQRDRPPYVWQLETGEEAAPDFGEGLTVLLNRLRRRESADLHRLDMRASVQASVRNAGRALFRFREQTRPPEYLLLIDRYDANDHSARWFDAFFRELVRAEVPVWRYFYQGDPRICFDEAHPQGIALGELLQRHRDARLLLFGEGQRLLLPTSGQLAPWTALFAGWRRRALLLPKPAREWGRREQVLAALFPVSPASIQGIDIALEQFETFEQRSPAEALRRAGDAILEPLVFEGSLLATLKRHFPEPLLSWIAACAVYPALHWDLTLFLGRTLSEPGQAPLATAGNLRQIFRLPWFAQGRIPENARLQLLEYLAAQGLETQVRKALDELLRRAPAPPKDSVAWDEHRMHIILNELLLKPDAKQRRALEAEFERFLAAGKQPDFVAFKQLQRKPTSLDFLVPDRWKKYFFRHGSARFGLRYLSKLLPGLALLALGLALIPVQTRICEGETQRYEGRTLCLTSPADQLIYLEFLTRDAIEAQDHRQADSLRSRAGALARQAGQPTDTTAFYHNTAVYYHNYAARVYNCTLRPAPGCPDLEADSLQQLACDNFRRGVTLHAAIAGEQRIEFAMALQQTCREATSTAPVPTSEAPDAKALDAAAWRRAESTNTPEGYGEYLARFPDGTHAEEARRRQRDGSTAREREIWLAAARENTIAAYENYLRQYPDGAWRAEAESLLKGRRDASNWEQATRENTPTAYENYRRNFPDGAHAAEAVERISTLLDEADWQRTLAANTPVAYQAYLKAHPNGKYAAEAKKRTALPSDDQVLETLAANLVWVRGGTFTMGCTQEQGSDCFDWEKPAHRVTLSDFYIGKYEVTQKEWREVMGSSPSYFKNCDNCPVESVSWEDIQEFLTKLNAKTGKRYRLPTEAEWEYAARGGASSRDYKYAGSNSLDEVAWYTSNSGSKTHPVGEKKANELGLYDMSGNVWEWCQDWYGDYPSDAQTNPRGPDRASGRVLRGGGWSDVARDCRTSFRINASPSDRLYYLGFRLAL